MQRQSGSDNPALSPLHHQSQSQSHRLSRDGAFKIPWWASPRLVVGIVLSISVVLWFGWRASITGNQPLLPIASLPNLPGNFDRASYFGISFKKTKKHTTA